MGDDDRILYWSRGLVEWRFLSHFHPCRIVVESGTFNSAEQYYFWLLAETDNAREKILACRSAYAVKKLSKSLFLDESRRDDAMLESLAAKFEIPELGTRLLATGDRPLIHYTPWGDREWGVDSEFRGQNKQGRMIEHVRDALRKLRETQ